MTRPLWSSSLSVGELTIGSLATYVGIIEGGTQSVDYAILGNHVLRHYSVVLDYTNEEILFLKP
jgi:hypothetical protein